MGIQVNSQLLEAIQRKVELSQQLEQWQVDMEQLLEGQMRERLLYGDKRVHSSASAMSVSSECSEGGNGNTQPRTASRIFNFSTKRITLVLKSLILLGINIRTKNKVFVSVC